MTVGWPIHTLGDLDLRWTEGFYAVDGSSSEIDENRLEELVPLRSSDGARLSYSRGVEMPLTLNVYCLGDTKAEAKAARVALNQVLIDARNARATGDYPTYSFQEDVSESEPEVFYVVGGKLRGVRSFDGGAPALGWNGPSGNRAVALAVLDLKLSRA